MTLFLMAYIVSCIMEKTIFELGDLTITYNIIDVDAEREHEIVVQSKCNFFFFLSSIKLSAV